jgi:hypothetical protein
MIRGSDPKAADVDKDCKVAQARFAGGAGVVASIID